MKIFITGGAGFMGSILASRLSDRGHQITVLSHSPGKRRRIPYGVRVLHADATRPGTWQNAVAEHDAVINLAGVSIFARWTGRRKRAIYNSRIFITRNIVEAIRTAEGKKPDLLSASAMAYYGPHGDEEVTESDGTGPERDFLTKVSRDWEAEALKAEQYGARVVITRFGVILGRGGGAMDVLALLFKLHLGNWLGSGRQWFSWIHADDLASIFAFLLEHKKIRGAVNCAAPDPVTNKQLTDGLNRALRSFPIVPPAPGFVLTCVLGELGSFVLKGQRAVPRRLLDEGFTFNYPDLDKALADILHGG
jgi:uncharacterized protein (TIGR01777 family)